jgi:hypothetical protein
MRRTGLFDTVVVCLAITAPMLVASPALAASADKRFEAISGEEYAWRLAQSGPSEDGPKSEAFKLPDVGPAVQAARLARWTAPAPRAC